MISKVPQTTEKSDYKLSWWYRLLGYVLLIGAVLGGSSIGVLTNMIGGANTFVKTTWRMAIQLLYLLIPMIIELYIQRKTFSFCKALTLSSYLMILAASVCNAGWGFGLLYSSEHLI